MTASVRKGDIGSGHSCHYPPTNATSGSPDVFINDIPAVRVGDSYAAHGCPTCPAPDHPRKQAEGSPTIFINGRPAARIGDAIDCGGVSQTGAPNVFFDDGDG
ncbi:PAAR domain-containing protein [Bartonella sp. HY038]|uniref:PAAR domain-containing protein n=1 Tax=Bartonella sp. HY038 TaxID=2759660 RepID=UPI0015F9B77B|nr:PAAR domain-containing protein [Bartonella sp. HY038]